MVVVNGSSFGEPLRAVQASHCWQGNFVPLDGGTIYLSGTLGPAIARASLVYALLPRRSPARVGETRNPYFCRPFQKSQETMESRAVRGHLRNCIGTTRTLCTPRRVSSAPYGYSVLQLSTSASPFKQRKLIALGAMRPTASTHGTQRYPCRLKHGQGVPHQTRTTSAPPLSLCASPSAPTPSGRS